MDTRLNKSQTVRKLPNVTKLACTRKVSLHSFFGTIFSTFVPLCALGKFEKPFFANVTVINVLMRRIERCYYTFTLFKMIVSFKFLDFARVGTRTYQAGSVL